jgi:uncharacterized protein
MRELHFVRRDHMGSATFRFYGDLNDFLAPVSRQANLVARFDQGASVKDLVEALGVPHPEIDRLVVNGEPANFSYLVRNSDRIAVYPRFRVLDIGPAGSLQPPPQDEPRFVADVHLGRLTSYLRLAGFDTAYRNDAGDHELVVTSVTEDRTLLTRDVGLLKHRALTRGCFVRATQPGRQLVEVLRRFDLSGIAAPFTRCPRCNAALSRVERDRLEHLLPPRTRETFEAFSQCPACSQIYWEGSHHARIRAFLETAFAEAQRPD